MALDWLHPADAAPELDRLRPLDALPALREAVHRPALAAALGREGEILARLARIAGSVPCFHLKRPRSFDSMARVVGTIEALSRETAREGT